MTAIDAVTRLRGVAKHELKETLMDRQLAELVDI
jgi:hypothetical protein